MPHSGTLQNDLQLNPDKSEALVVGTANQLCVVLDLRLTLHKHDISIVAWSCNCKSLDVSTIIVYDRACI